MLTVLLTWLLAAALTTTLGAAAYDRRPRAGAPVPPPPAEWLSAVGLALLTAGLQLWSLAASVGSARPVLAAAAVLVLVSRRRAVAQWLRTLWQALRRPAGKTTALLTAVLLGWVLVYASQRPLSFDVGLYTLQTLQWAEHYPVMPGLGNLHGRLAFNSSWFLPTALLKLPTPAGAAYGLSSYPLALLAVAAGRGLSQGLRHPGATGAGAWAPLVLVLVLLHFFQSRLSSALTDSPAAALLSLLGLHYAACWRRAAGLGRADALAGLLVALLLVTIKLSVLPVLLLAAQALWSTRRLAGRAAWLMPLGLAGLVLGPWLARNALLSGYLVYPLPALDWLSVDWKVPAEAARIEQNLIVNLARNLPHAVAAGPVAANWSWLGQWWALSRPDQQALLLVAALSVLAAAWRWRRGVPRVETGWAVGWLTGWLGSGFWLLAAPDFRFGLGFLLLAALSPWLAAEAPLPGPRGRLVLGAALLLWLGQQMRDPLYHLRTDPPRFATRVLWPEPAPAAATVPWPIGGGWVRVPQRGWQCYAAPLPCARCGETGLMRRGPRLSQGFRRRP
ncbi:LIC_10190 family membrane protein [Hymenobacter sp. B81]|uniref:LIC_10190 family membrane protein n=1 Tax=Hymenobacter sp. B81 TaxID=3344878 RepID=UPI0037DC4E11